MVPKGTVLLFKCEICSTKHFSVCMAEGLTPYVVPCCNCGGPCVKQELIEDKEICLKFKFVKPAHTDLPEPQKSFVMRGGLLLTNI